MAPGRKRAASVDRAAAKRRRVTARSKERSRAKTPKKSGTRSKSSGKPRSRSSSAGTPKKKKRRTVKKRCPGMPRSWSRKSNAKRKTTRRLDDIKHDNIFCYMLKSEVWDGRGCTYVGYTVDDVESRLAQHNGETAGGATRTKKHQPWGIFSYVSGFCTQRCATRFEFRLEHRNRWSEGAALWKRASSRHLKDVAPEPSRRYHYAALILDESNFVQRELACCAESLALHRT